MYFVVFLLLWECGNALGRPLPIYEDNDRPYHFNPISWDNSQSVSDQNWMKNVPYNTNLVKLRNDLLYSKANTSIIHNTVYSHVAVLCVRFESIVFHH